MARPPRRSSPSSRRCRCTCSCSSSRRAIRCLPSACSSRWARSTSSSPGSPSASWPHAPAASPRPITSSSCSSCSPRCWPCPVLAASRWDPIGKGGMGAPTTRRSAATSRSRSSRPSTAGARPRSHAASARSRRPRGWITPASYACTTGASPTTASGTTRWSCSTASIWRRWSPIGDRYRRATSPGSAPRPRAPSARRPGAGSCTAIWSTGATLVFALTGTRVRDAGGKRPSELVAGVPAALDDVLMRTLDAAPARRPTTAAELADALDATGLADGRPPLRIERTTDGISENDDTVDATATHGETRVDAPAARDRRAPPGSSG